MNKTLIAIIVIVALLVVGGVRWMQKSKSPVAPQSGLPPSQPAASDTTASISEQLNAVDTGTSLDQEFYSIDQDVNVL